MVQNFDENSFSGGKSKKNGVFVEKISFSLKKKAKRNVRYHEFMAKPLSILAG